MKCKGTTTKKKKSFKEKIALLVIFNSFLYRPSQIIEPSSKQYSLKSSSNFSKSIFHTPTKLDA